MCEQFLSLPGALSFACLKALWCFVSLPESSPADVHSHSTGDLVFLLKNKECNDLVYLVWKLPLELRHGLNHSSLTFCQRRRRSRSQRHLSFSLQTPVSFIVWINIMRLLPIQKTCFLSLFQKVKSDVTKRKCLKVIFHSTLLLVCSLTPDDSESLVLTDS